MIAALTGLVHDRQCAADYERNRDKDRGFLEYSLQPPSCGAEICHSERARPPLSCKADIDAAPKDRRQELPVAGGQDWKNFTDTGDDLRMDGRDRIKAIRPVCPAGRSQF